MDKPKRLVAGLFLPLAMFLGTALAAPFDVKTKSPAAATAQEAQPRLKAHFETFDRKLREGPGAFIRDKAAHKQWSDLYYSITLAMDEGKPLDNLADVGLVRNADGTYTVDLKKFPQWAPLDTRMFVLTNPDIVESYVPALKARGFRDADVDALRAYVATHDPRQFMLAEGKPLASTFAARVKQRDKARLPTDLDEARAYFYQKRRIEDEGQRRWAVGLLDVLDNQRQRILASYFDELASKQQYGLPSESFDVVLERDVERLRTGEYLQLIATEETQIQRAQTERAEKLNGGQQK